MKVQLLISAMHADSKELVKKMNVFSEAILINQCDENSFESFFVEDVVEELSIDKKRFAERVVSPLKK